MSGEDGRVDPERNDKLIRFLLPELPLNPVPRPDIRKGDKVRVITDDGVGEYEVTDVQAVDDYAGTFRVSFDPR